MKTNQASQRSDDSTRRRILSIRRSKLKLTDYLPTEKSISGRIAEFLRWAADSYPQQVITYEEITQAILRLGKLPAVNSKQVANMRSSLSRARAVMRTKYQRDIVTEKGVGARATVGSADALQTSVMREVTTHERSCRRLKETVVLVNSRELDAEIAAITDPDIRDGLRIARDFFNEHLVKYVKTLDKATTVAALLPPPAAVVTTS